MTRNETEDAARSQADGRQRIAKLMARVGLCSRRDAEAWIVDGRVTVNGAILTSPALDVGPSDVILVDGVPLPQAERTRLFLFHKPRGLVTSDHDPEGRATVTDYLHEHWPDGPRVVTIGRLDINTEGLLLLTNDGGLARLLELPKTGWVRRYRVRAKGETDQSVLDRLRDGVSIDGIDYAGIDAVLDRQQGANVWLTMGLREGKNREVKRVLEHIGLEVNRLIRLSFGPFQLGDVPEGAVEEVRTRVLRDQLGAALAAAAGVAFEDATPPPEAKPIRADRKPGRTTGAEQTNKAVRPPPARRDARGSRPERPRGSDRPLRRSNEVEAPLPIRERPTAGTRKHVSKLRADEAEATQRGPRRRIERGDLTDRRDRKVAVERVVSARPTTGPIEPTRARGPARPRRDDAPGGFPGKPGHRQASPSALAKQARTARSGGRPGDERKDRGSRDDMAPPQRRERPADAPRGRARPTGNEPRAPRPDSRRRDGERRHTAPGDREERPRKRFEDKRPPRDDRAPGAARRSDGPRAAGPRGASDGERRRSAPGGRGAERSETRPSRPRGERPERGERPARNERPDRSERPARGDRPARGERPARSEGREPRRDGAKFEGKRPGAVRPARGAGGERRDGPSRAERTGKRPAASAPGGERRGPPRGAPGGRPGAGGKPRPGPGRGKPPRGSDGAGRGKPRPKG